MGIDAEEPTPKRQPADAVRAGDHLGRFEILGPLGAGGMGLVYRARDPQLGREVAIKVLPSAFRSDPDRRRRFEREARAAASLNHPNVLAVHEFGIHEGIAFIVTELLQGETLRKHIAGRALAPQLAVEYAIQIAAGLAAGHEHGIVHRDIKPENLFVTPDRRIKILDFGLARMTDPTGDTATVTYDGALPAPAAGTPAYMAPEQVQGRPADHRADLFAVGVVLYEMLAGFSPFRRGSAAESLDAVLHDELPDPGGVSPELWRLVRRCIEKVPEQRFQNARDLMFALEGLPPGALTRRSGRGERRRTKRVVVAASIALLLLSVAGIVGFVLARAKKTAASEASFPQIERLTDRAGLEEFPSLSPDGRSVAFTASVNGRRQLFVRLLSGGMPVQITNDGVDHEIPRWSADGNTLFYFSPAAAGQVEGEIWRIPALGGSPRRVTRAISGADVGRDGRLAFFRLVDRNVQLVTSSPDGTSIEVVAPSVPGYHLFPRWSPDGRFLAFQRGDGVRYDLFVIPSRGGETRQLTRDKNVVRGLAWLPDGTGLIYASSRRSTIAYLPPLALWRVGLDGGESQQLTPGDVWYEQPDVDAAGMVTAGRMNMHFDLWKLPFDTDAKESVRLAQQLTRQTAHLLTPTAAPDGDRIAFLSDSGGHSNLWVLSTASGQQRQITFEDQPDVRVGVPVWSPDGRSIAFVSSKGRTGLDFGLWLVDPDGGNLRNAAARGLGFAWSDDGRWLYYVETAPATIRKVRPAGGPSVTVRTEAARNVIGTHGSTLYFMVEHVLLDGRPELEIRAATPENGPSRPIARIAASRVPSWQIVNPALSPDGEWLAMPLTDGYTTNIWALSTRSGAWRQVTDFGDRATFIARRVSWSPDGRSILAAVGEGDMDIVLLDGLLPRAKRGS